MPVLYDPRLKKLFWRPVYTYRHRWAAPLIILTDNLTRRMGVEPILPIRRPVIIGTIIKLDGNSVGMCKQTFTHCQNGHTQICEISVVTWTLTGSFQILFWLSYKLNRFSTLAFHDQRSDFYLGYKHNEETKLHLWPKILQIYYCCCWCFYS